MSTALGAAQHFAQTTLVTGDLTLLHDLNALALQRELRLQREAAACVSASLDAASSEAAGAVTPGHAADAASGNVAPGAVPSIVIVLLNNNGGGIFDMLPQRSEDAYFERLFLTPQDVEFGAAAQAFGVPHRLVETVAEFDAAYDEALGVPGISLVEVRVPLEGLPRTLRPVLVVTVGGELGGQGGWHGYLANAVSARSTTAVRAGGFAVRFSKMWHECTVRAEGFDREKPRPGIMSRHIGSSGDFRGESVPNPYIRATF